MKRMSMIAVMVLAAACGKPERYVLVHGAFMGAWAWSGVKTGLEKQGATVSTVELPAHGADPGTVGDATLDAYVARVGQAVDAAKGERVVLVGHSMGGMVISQYAEKNAAKLDRLVYLAAYLPKDGEALTDLAYSDADSHLGPALEVDMMAGTGGIPDDKLQDIFCADCTETAMNTIVSQYRDEPLRPLGEKVSLGTAFAGVPKRYVYTTQDNAVSNALQRRMTDGVTLAGSATLDTSHSPFLSKVDDTVKALSGTR